MKRKFLLVLLAAFTAVGLLAGCGTKTESENGQKQVQQPKQEETKKTAEEKKEEPQNEQEEDSSAWIGVILSGDETESYTLAHIEGIREAAAAAEIPKEDIIWKERVNAKDGCPDTIKELVKSGCRLIISNSGVYENSMKEAAEKNPDVDFVAVGGEQAAGSGLPNFYDARTCAYEADYVAGAVAGLKLRQLDQEKQLPDKSRDRQGNIKLGYVAAEADSRVRAGINAYFKGVQSVYPKVVMQVEYTGAWSDSDAEATAAGDLIRAGCVILAGNTDLDAMIQTAESANESGKCVYAVGRNTDVRKTAKQSALLSVINVWSVYYTQLFDAELKGTSITKNWVGGYEKNAVRVTAPGKNAAPGTVKKIKKLQDEIRTGKKQITSFSARALDGITEVEKNKDQ